METTDDPRDAFRALDATNLDSDEYHINYGEDVATPDPVGDVIERGTARRRVVEFRDSEAEDDSKLLALRELLDDSIVVDSEDDLPWPADLRVEYDGRTVFVRDADRCGYEIIQSKDPKRVGYTTVFGDAAVLL